MSDNEDIPMPQALAPEAGEDEDEPYYMPNFTAAIRKWA